MEVVVPRHVEAVASTRRRAQQRHVLRLVLGDEQRGPTARRFAYATADRREDVVVGGVVNRLGRVEAQAVEVELVDPVSGVGDEELAHGTRIGAVEVEGVAPLVGVAGAVVVGRELPMKRPVGTEVVVDDVENHPEAQRVGAVHETTKIVGLAVEPRRRIEVDAVVPPPEASGKIGDGHDLEHGHAQARERGQLAHRCRPRPFARERADVHLIEDLAVARDTAPAPVRPVEAVGIDDARRAVRSLRLEARCRIGQQALLLIEPVAVESAVAQVGHERREISIWLGVESPRVGRRLTLDHDVDPGGARRPHTEVHATGDDVRTHGKPRAGRLGRGVAGRDGGGRHQREHLMHFRCPQPATSGRRFVRRGAYFRERLLLARRLPSRA